MVTRAQGSPPGSPARFTPLHAHDVEARDDVAPPRFTAVPDAFERSISAPAAEPEKAILLFNSDCATCKQIAKWVSAAEAKDPVKDLIIRPIGDDPEELRALHPELNIWDAYKTVHVIMPDGSMKLGGDAVGEVLRRLPNMKTVSALLDFKIFGKKPFQKILDLAYHVLDQLRPAFGCETCGHDVPWWGLPVKWAVKAYKKLNPPPDPKKLRLG